MLEQNTLETILKEHLVNEIKERLHALIDNEIESIARDSVVKFMNIDISKSPSMHSVNDDIYFKFIQNITKTVFKTVVVKEKQ